MRKQSLGLLVPTPPSLECHAAPFVMDKFSGISLDKAGIISTVLEGVLYGELAEHVI